MNKHEINLTFTCCNTKHVFLNFCMFNLYRYTQTHKDFVYGYIVVYSSTHSTDTIHVIYGKYNKRIYYFINKPPYFYLLDLQVCETVLLLHLKQNICVTGIESTIKWAQCRYKYCTFHNIKSMSRLGMKKPAERLTRKWQIPVRVPIGAIFTNTVHL